jgi:hypothetical protein
VRDKSGGSAAVPKAKSSAKVKSAGADVELSGDGGQGHGQVRPRTGSTLKLGVKGKQTASRA